MKRTLKIITIITIALTVAFAFQVHVFAKKKITVTPKKLAKICKKYPTVNNKYARHYYGLNVCLEKIRKAGGGTLRIKKGTYKICNAVYVPSNTTVVFDNGVKMIKIKKTGNKNKPAASMFQLVKKSKSKKAESVGAYKASKNVKFKTKGKATIDMKNTCGIGIVVAHNDNVDISGLTFKGMNGDHYIEVNGSRNVKIHHNTFTKARASTLSKYYSKEAINIDTPDKATHGLPLKWVKHDKTPCADITIFNNTFAGTNRGVGTHKYSKQNDITIYHTNVKIMNNKFYDVFDNAVMALSWMNASIINNYFYNIGLKDTKTFASAAHAISGGGIYGITITGNTFENVKRNPVYFSAQKNNDAGSEYSKVLVNITKEQTKAMLNNKVINCGQDMNDIFHGYDILYFRNDGSRTRKNAVGINIKKKKIRYGLGDK